LANSISYFLGPVRLQESDNEGKPRTSRNRHKTGFQYRSFSHHFAHPRGTNSDFQNKKQKKKNRAFQRPLRFISIIIGKTAQSSQFPCPFPAGANRALSSIYSAEDRPKQVD
jgi:hypothetical protein